MLYRKVKQESFIILMVAALFAVSFTSEAAPIIPVETRQAIATMNPVNSSTIEAMNMAEEMIVEGKAKVAEEKAKEEALEETKKLLASIIFCEAGNQPYEGQVAVGAVIMNRVNSSKYPNTVEEVIYQSGQFCPAGSGWLDKVRNSESYTDSAMKAAEDALAGANPIGDCLYFDQGGNGMKIGAHYFH